MFEITKKTDDGRLGVARIDGDGMWDGGEAGWYFGEIVYDDDFCEALSDTWGPFDTEAMAIDAMAAHLREATRTEATARTYSVYNHYDQLVAGPGLSLQEAADVMQLNVEEVLWCMEEAEGGCDTDEHYLVDDQP